jgi:hypothetical protein
MKQIKVVFVGLIVLTALFAGCATAPGTDETLMVTAAVEKEPEQKPEAAAVDQVQAEPEKMPEPEKDQYVPVAKAIFLSNGVKDSFVLYTYSDDNQFLLEEATYLARGDLEERIIYEYENGLLSQSIVYNDIGDPLSIHRYTYADQKLATTELFLTKNETLLWSSEYVYDDDGGKAQWNLFDQTGNLLGYSRYLYDDLLGTVVRIENFSPGDVLEEYVLNTVNDDGNIVKEVVYNSDDTVIQETNSSYNEDGLLQSIEFFFGRRNMGSTEYDSEQNPVEIVRKNGNGLVMAIEKIDYVKID